MKKKITNLKLLTGTLALTAAMGMFPYHVLADSSNYTSSVTVSPDEDDDFDGYAVDVNFTTKDGVLTNINLSSEWGRKAAKNKTYSTNALVGIVNSIKGTSANPSGIDVVSGATCSSNAIKHAITDAYNASTWTSVSANLTASVNGTPVSGSIADDDDDDNSGQKPSGKPDNDSGNNSNGKPPREDNSLTLPDGTAASYQNLSVEDGVINIQFQLPDGYTPSGINLIRLGNTAIMPARDPESFDRIFAFNTDTGVLSIKKDHLDGSTVLTVSLKFTDGTENGTTDIIVSILSESSISLSDKTTPCTGKNIEIDPATVTGSTGSVSYTYYSDEACTKQLDGLPVNAGTYYVIASVAEDSNYYGASSQPAKLTITPAEENKKDTFDNGASDNETSNNTDTNTSTDTGNATTTSNTPTTSTGTSSTASTPKTGDTSPLLPLAGLLSGSLAVIGGFLKFRKRI